VVIGAESVCSRQTESKRERERQKDNRQKRESFQILSCEASASGVGRLVEAADWAVCKGDACLGACSLVMVKHKRNSNQTKKVAVIVMWPYFISFGIAQGQEREKRSCKDAKKLAKKGKRPKRKKLLSQESDTEKVVILWPSARDQLIFNV
jgi:hypothetical protein